MSRVTPTNAQNFVENFVWSIKLCYQFLHIFHNIKDYANCIWNTVSISCEQINILRTQMRTSVSKSSVVDYSSTSFISLPLVHFKLPARR